MRLAGSRWTNNTRRRGRKFFRIPYHALVFKLSIYFRASGSTLPHLWRHSMSSKHSSSFSWSKRSLNCMTRSLEMWYLHGPDRTVPYEETLRVVNDLYKEGYFKRFGISNYTAYVYVHQPIFSYLITTQRWEVAEIVGICKANGYIQPTAYQGIYNAIHRSVEAELLPCLRKFGISFYEFNPCEYNPLIDSHENIRNIVHHSGRRVFHWTLYLTERRTRGRLEIWSE